MTDIFFPIPSPEDFLSKWSQTHLLPQEPAMIFDIFAKMIDVVNGLWVERFNCPLFRLTQLRAQSELAKKCYSAEELTQRIQALSLLLDEMDIDKKKYGGKLHDNACKPINLLEQLLSVEMPHFKEREKIIEILRHIRGIRNLFPAHQDAGHGIRALWYFKFPYPLRPRQEEEVWDTVRLAFLECLYLLQKAFDPTKFENPFLNQARRKAWKASIKKSKEDWLEVQELYKRAIEIDPRNADAYVQLGDACLETGDDEEALIAFLRATKIRPDFAEAYFAMGLAYQNLELEKAAFEAYKEAALLDPGHWLAFEKIGQHYLSLNQYEDARKAFEVAINTENFSGYDLYVKLAECYVKMKQYTAAIETYNTLLECVEDSESYENYRLEAHKGIGECHYFLGEYDKALDAFQKAISLDPADVLIYLFLAWIYIAVEDKTKAREKISVLTSLMPKTGSYWSIAARLFIQVEMRDESLNAIKEAIKCEPKIAEHYLFYGVLLLVMGNIAEAKEQYDILLALDESKAEQLHDWIRKVEPDQ